MAVELLTEAPLAPPAGLGPYRRWDYEGLPDQPRCELLFGRLYAMPSPSWQHQAVVLTMWLHFDRIARASSGRACAAPMDVTLADHSVVQPDVIYVSPARLAILQRRIDGAPDLLVEVLSPGTARRDRGEKLILYAQSGIREYWIVDPEVRQIELLVNEAGRFVVAWPVAGLYQSQSLPEVHLDVAELWRQVETRLPPAPPPPLRSQ
jgi:Uma2 family endonuclease